MSDPTPEHERRYLKFLEGATFDKRFSLPVYASGAYPEGMDGRMFLDTDRGVPAWWDGDNYEQLMFVHNDDVLLETQTVANTTTSTQVYEASIDDTALVQGRVFQLDLMGSFSTANNSDSFSVDVNLGGNDLAGVTNVPANATDVPWSVEFTFTVRSGGDTGTIAAHTRGLFNGEPVDAHGGEKTIDTTTESVFTVDLQWDAAAAGNSATLDQAHVKQMA